METDCEMRLRVDVMQYYSLHYSQAMYCMLRPPVLACRWARYVVSEPIHIPHQSLSQYYYYRLLLA